MTEQSGIFQLSAPAAEAPAGYMRDGKGRLVPEKAVSDADKLIDQTVRKIIGFARVLEAQIARFKGHCFDDVAALQYLLDEQYGAKRGGEKGNVTLVSFDGLYKVAVQIADNLTFGPELQSAKLKVDECIGRWAAGAKDEIRALVNHAFAVDQQGKINRAALFQLRRLKIEDEDWKLAMQALTDSIRVIGSKEYIRFYYRTGIEKPWMPVLIDLAAVERQ
jgi:hypothetical protein